MKITDLDLSTVTLLQLGEEAQHLIKLRIPHRVLDQVITSQVMTNLRMNSPFMTRYQVNLLNALFMPLNL
jgi:hypothetical protein